MSERPTWRTELGLLGRAIGFGLLAGIGFFFGWTLVAIPIGVWALGMAVSALAGEKTPRSAYLTGWLAWGLVMPLAGALVIGRAIASTSAGSTESVVAMLVPAAACLGASLLAAPLARAAAWTTRTDASLPDALAEGWLEARSRSGFVLGVGHGLSIVSVVGVAAVGVALARFASAWLGVLVLVATPFVFGLVVMFSLRFAARAAGPARRRRWRALGYVAVPLATLALALAVSSPMSRPRPGHVELLAHECDEAADGFVLEDGAPAVRPPAFSHGGWPECGRDGTAFYVGYGLYAAVFDLSGHRLDDGPWDRLWARFGEGGAWLLGGAAFLGLCAVVMARRARREVSARHATTLRLELGEGAQLRVENGAAVPSGEVMLVSPEHDRVVRLEAPLPWLGAWTTALEAGASVVLVTPSAEAFLGPRTGSSSAPVGAWLSDGDVDVSLARHAARAAAGLGAAAAVLSLLGSAWALIWM